MPKTGGVSKLTVSTAAAEKHAKLINEAWQKTVPAIVETGRCIVEARDKLEHGEFQNLIPMLNCGRSTAFALIKIASHPVLSKVQHVGLLPPSWGTLAELARLDGKKLEAAIEKGTVHPQMERKDVAALLLPPKEKATKAKLPLGWLRHPLADCPVCEGKGEVGITSLCGVPDDDRRLTRGPCPCVQLGGDSRTPEFRAMMQRVRERIDRDRDRDCGAGAGGDAGGDGDAGDEQLKTQETSEFVASPETVARNLRDWISQHYAGAEAARKVIKASHLEDEVRQEIGRSIGRLIQKWKIVLSTLGLKVGDVITVTRDAEPAPASADDLAEKLRAAEIKIIGLESEIKDLKQELEPAA
jgi:hypothetical protein